ncbi:MAG: 30S ribosomal protein S1 [Cyclobacteriaceae bacterium]|nr:30S ribosomal protein S1 [Cyclobacteriaceae bacterium]MCX7636998.1 30S ribosomal protein S1 [Cyclobacteriaceae bacterium]MDW8330121.1 30S ribosomal protein S1 [Cyclobacteriaceae bacterium]
MSKEKEKKDSPEQELVEELKATRKKMKAVAETDDVDPLEEARALKKVAEEVDTEAIPVIELKKGLRPRQTPEEFDWDSVNRKGLGRNYSPEQRAEMEKLYTGTIADIKSGEVVTGTIVGINDRDVILNIGFKSDGLVPLAEFKDQPDIKIGDQVEVFVEEREDKIGQLILSRRKARLFKGWQKIQQALDEDAVIEGFVKRRTKGGLIVDVFGIEAFLPGSQIDVKPIRDFDIYVGKAMEVKVVKINYANNNVVVSHKVLIEKDIEEQKAAILRNLEKGQVLEGTIKNMTNFGVFIDLGGVDGLLHITDISWGRINHPEEVLKLDQVVKVVVLDFDEEKKRISLGMKQLTPHPWDSLPADIQVGSRVKGKVVNVADYGAFVELQPGVEGLIHVSEMSWSQHLRNPQDFLKVGDEVEAVVLTIDREERKMSLGLKQLTEDPWTRQDVLTKYAVGTRHTGIVRNLTNFGLFLELEEGIDGLVHVSDLSWTRKIKHPSEFTKVGEKLDVVVLELDVANRRLALSHKHLEENPWDTFETIFTPGSVHKGTIINKTDKGLVIELPYGIEGFCSVKNAVKADGSKPEAGESLDFKVLEFSKDERKIVLSHKATYSAAEEEKPAAKKAKQPSKGKTIEKINQEVEKSTLGDLEALSALKQKLDNSASASEEK